MPSDVSFAGRAEFRAEPANSTRVIPCGHSITPLPVKRLRRAVHNVALFHSSPLLRHPARAGPHAPGMPGLPDPADLDALADRIAGHAGATRARATRLGAAVAATGWRGPAASAFGNQAEFAVAGLRAAALRLDDAADALRRHARHIGALFAGVQRLGVDELGLLDDALFHPGQLIPDTGELIGDGVGVLGDALGLIGF